MPPDSRYAAGMKGSIRSIAHSGTSRSNRARSRANIIQGSALLAPDTGPLDGNSHSAASGSNGASGRWRYTSRDHAVTQGSTITIPPPPCTARRGPLGEPARVGKVVEDVRHHDGPQASGRERERVRVRDQRHVLPRHDLGREQLRE